MSLHISPYLEIPSFRTTLCIFLFTTPAEEHIFSFCVISHAAALYVCYAFIYPSLFAYIYLYICAYFIVSI